MQRGFCRAVLLIVFLSSAVSAGIHDVTYPSALNKVDIPIKVYTPPGYESEANERYPVVYDLHGGGGSPERQWDRTRATLTDAMENRRVRPMIYVFVNGLGNTEFVNTADGKLIERSIIEELVPFIDGRYRTIAAKHGRALDGFSMGGFGCLSVGFRNPDKFCAVVSYGAALTIKGEGKNYRSREHFAEHDPWSVVRVKADAVRQGLRVRMTCGDTDRLYRSNVKFKELLDGLNIPVDWMPVPGVAHCTQCLYEEVGLDSLKFLAESFEIAAKGGAMNVAVKRLQPAQRVFAGVHLSDEPPPFRPSGALPRLRVSESGRFLVTEKGQPFFWLADTAWLLFQNLDREGVDKYFEDRAAKQFSVVLAHILPWRQGDTNVSNEVAFLDKAYSKPNEKYWQHADHVVNQAAAKALYIGILPMWCRNYINRKAEPDAPALIDAQTAFAYGRFLGKRYGGKTHVIWVLGGDAEPKYPEIHDAMAKGIIEGAGGDAGKVLMTYHPNGNPGSSSAFFQDRPWLDFNLLQSSHDLWKLNYQLVEKDYALKPPKPTIEGEPNYEHHPIRHRPENGVFNAWHVRMKAYWSVFAGGAGFTYGGNGIWQMDRAGKPPHRASHANLTWDKALDLPGAVQMKHLRRLIESRPFLSRVPNDKTVLISPAGEREDRIEVTRGVDRTWALFYLTTGQDVEVSMANLKGPEIVGWWFNPRDGRTYDNEGRSSDGPLGTFTISQSRKVFNPPGRPSEDNDWVLVLDNAGRKFPPPGQR